MKILETQRLILREILETDAEFILDLLNQPSFIRFIGDRGVRTIEESKDFINNRYRKSYEDHGFGLWTVELKDHPPATAGGTDKNVPIGICGLVKRDSLPDPDIGFAFLPDYWGKGYAFEAAKATLEYAREVVGAERILAITDADNESSGKLLEKIGLTFEGMTKQPHDENELKLFSVTF